MYVNYDLKVWIILSLQIALLTAFAAAAGVIAAQAIYPTAELRANYVPTDITTLIVGLPLLLISIWLVRRGLLLGLLLWPAAVFYGLYNYFAFLLGAPLSWMTIIYLLIMTLSLYTLIGIGAAVNGAAVKEQVDGRVPVRLAGGVLFAFGAGFMLRSMAEMTGPLTSQEILSQSELALLLTDFIAGAAWLIGGILLWRRTPFGYVGGTGALFQGAMLFMSVIIVMIIQSVTGDIQHGAVDFGVIWVMALVCFVPAALFIRRLRQV